MSNYVEFLFPKESRHRVVLHDIVQEISQRLMDEQMTVPQIVESISLSKKREPFANQQDLSIRKKILAAIVGLLDDGMATEKLVSKLYSYEKRYLATIYLGWLGSKAHTALDLLIDDVAVAGNNAGAAKRAITLIGNADRLIVAAVNKSLAEGDEFAFWQLYDLVIVAGYGESPEFLRILEVASKHENQEIREGMIYATARLPPPIKEKLRHVLQELLNDPNEEVQEAALEALNRGVS
ncbi:MAG: HEAT repeat domain-containing protein [Chloroflexota bacterium]